MTLRICLVTPFAWSQPHDVNEHVAGIAKELRALGHAVTILAPSGRTADLFAGRRALARGENADVIAIGAAVQISRRSSLGVPVGVRANVRLALQNGRFDIVHGFEPGLPSISYVALRDSEALGVATFFSPERLGFPPRRALREKLLARLDALLATSEQTAAAAADRFPGDYRVISRGVDTELFRPAAKRKLVVIELHSGSLPVARAALRSLRELPGWEALLLRTKPLSTRPAIPLALRDRVRVRSGRTAAARAGALAEAAIVVPAPTGSARLRLEAAAAGAALADPPGVLDQPELAAAAVARLAEDEALRERRGREGRAAAEAQSFAAVARSSTGSTAGSAAAAATRRRDADPLADRPWILADLHMHTSWSHDCSIEVADLLDHAEAEGLGAIAVTDHNAIGGALEAVELARGRDLIVIPGEEVKTDDQGEVIGLFLREEIPRGMSSPRRSPRSASRRASSTSRTRSTGCTRSRSRRPSTATCTRSTCSRSTTPACSSRATTTRRCASRASTGFRPARARTRTSSRESARARCGCARSRARRSSCSRCAPPRFCAGRSRSRTSRASSGWRKSRRKSARREPRDDSVSASPTDEIYDRYLKKAISEINELGDEVGRSGDEKHVPVLGSGHPLADVFLLKYEPQASEVQEGVAFYGRAGQALLKSLQRLRVDPMAVYGTNCLKLAGQDPEEARPWLVA